MDYQIVNNTDNPIFVERFRITVPAKGKTRVLTGFELMEANKTGLPGGLVLNPVLLEAQPNLDESQEVDEKGLGEGQGTKNNKLLEKRGRKKVK